MNEQKQYLIALEKNRSITALVAGILVFCITLATVAVVIEVNVGAEENRLHYFTTLSNLLSAVGAAFMIPYAVEGIRKKRFTLPRWIVMLQYAGATCVAITMAAALLLILPTQGISAVQGTDFWLHLITPICTIVLFQCVETGVSLTRRNTILALIPYWCYMIVYYIMVVVVGKEHGGWSDFYMTGYFWPVWISIILMLAVGFGVATVLRIVQNRRALQSRNRITRLWQEDMDATELRIEAFGLGRYMGKHCGGSDLAVPVDIFEMMAERFDVSMDDLTRAFVKGALDARKGRDGE